MEKRGTGLKLRVSILPVHKKRIGHVLCVLNSAPFPYSGLFVEYAEKRGLSERERQILQDIAINAGLKRNESIFTLPAAFERGAVQMIEEGLVEQGGEQSKQLQTELSFLREKLGFRKQHPASMGSVIKSEKRSSRQIPAGKKLYISKSNILGSGDIECTITKNDDKELTVELERPIEATVGEVWRGRCYFGASVWEFETRLVKYNGNTLVLNHSDKIRFVNRRCFHRVSMNKSAFIARFPFSRMVNVGSESDKEGIVNRDLGKTSGAAWGPPEFVPAVLTELAGPGLCIESTLEVKTGEKVLVMFKLDEEKDVNTPEANADYKILSTIIEDIGEVRNVKAIENGLSIAVELTDLSDSEVNELIRATNAASIRKVHIERQNFQAAAANDRVAEENVGEAVAAQGV